MVCTTEWLLWVMCLLGYRPARDSKAKRARPGCCCHQGSGDFEPAVYTIFIERALVIEKLLHLFK